MGKDKVVAMILVVMAFCGAFIVAQEAQQVMDRREADRRAQAEIVQVKAEVRNLSRHQLGEFVVRDGYGEDDIVDRAGWSESNIKPEILREEFWRLNRHRAGVHDPLREGDKVVFPLYKK